MNNEEYAESIRMDSPKAKAAAARVKELSAVRAAITARIIYLCVVFLVFVMGITRPDPPVLWADAFYIFWLIINIIAFNNVLRRYVFVEIQYMRNEIREIEKLRT